MAAITFNGMPGTCCKQENDRSYLGKTDLIVMYNSVSKCTIFTFSQNSTPTPLFFYSKLPFLYDVT